MIVEPLGNAPFSSEAYPVLVNPPPRELLLGFRVWVLGAIPEARGSRERGRLYLRMGHFPRVQLSWLKTRQEMQGLRDQWDTGMQAYRKSKVPRTTRTRHASELDLPC